MEGAVALQPGEDAVLHGQRPEGLLSRLLLGQAWRHLQLRHGDRRAELFRKPWRSSPARRGSICRSRTRNSSARRRSGSACSTRSRPRRGLFEDALTAREGREALSYAERRGLTRETLKEFRIGFAPNAKETLKGALLKQGFTEAQLLEAGLVIKPDDGRPTYDRFRNRLTIPILDAKSRVIAFGARALDPDAEPKYLNSPETRLFDKGSIAVQFRARAPGRLRQERAGRGRRLYGRHRAASGGLRPLPSPRSAPPSPSGRWSCLWQLAPEPIVCFDGDRAGEAAAARAIDRMLPNLREGRSFRFAFLPQGSDPDDLVRSKGARAFAEMSCRRAAADRCALAAGS